MRIPLINRGAFRILIAVSAILLRATLLAQAKPESPRFSVSGAIDWGTYSLEATISLDLRSAGIRMPSGRAEAEALVKREAAVLLRDKILELRLDSRSLVTEAIAKGELSHETVEGLLAEARAQRAGFSEDFKEFKVDFSLSLIGLQASLVKHSQPFNQARSLEYRPTKEYSGIVIYATEALPVRGEFREDSLQPSFFPRIWDEEMSLVLERNMAEPEAVRRQGLVAFRGRDDRAFMEDRVGAEPLRILASGVFGSRRTDLIISREDALSILANEKNRQLLAEGKVVIVAPEVRQVF